MRASLLFPTVHVANSLEEAEHHLSEEPIDIVFIAMRKDRDAINRFIKRLKQELAGRDAAYVLLLEGRRNSVEIARTLVDGADAILLRAILRRVVAYDQPACGKNEKRAFAGAPAGSLPAEVPVKSRRSLARWLAWKNQERLPR